jgi:predicted NACHT family NTPase
LEKLFETYDTLVFFDGLDEVIDQNERIAIRNDIENFSRSHHKVRIFVTSRYESYREVYFKDDDFKIYEVLDLDDTQINSFVQKWYRLAEEDVVLRNEEVTSCLLELEKIEDELKRNPLLLTLILLLYRNEQELPTSKLDVYEGCTNTLVETRDDREKRLSVGLQISNKIATFAALAFWQHSNMQKKGNNSITSKDALLYLKNYLLKKQDLSMIMMQIQPR